MDLSKLPRLSGGGPGDAGRPAQAQQDLPIATKAPPDISMSAGSIWLSLIVGLIFLFLGMPFARWLAAAASGQPFVTNVTWTGGEKAGQPVAYWELQGGTAWTDCGMFLFGAAAIVHALAALMYMKSSAIGLRAVAAWIGIAAIAIATGFNLLVSLKLLSMSIFPLFSAIAVATGGYLLIEQFTARRSPAVHA